MTDLLGHIAPGEQATPAAVPSEEVRLRLYRSMVEMRDFEKRAYDLFLQGLVKGTSHLGLGQEAIAAGFGAAMHAGDYTFATYRGHNHALARGVPMAPAMAELMGRRLGLMAGKGGSMHLTSVAHRMMGSYAIIGAHLTIANGAAWSSKLRGTSEVTVCFFGDGTTNIGAFHEALNLAVVWRLPVVFVCENNAWMEYSALGYSGTNSGGILTVQHSQFDNNQDGFDTNTQIASDPPPPQNGACPDGGTSALSGTTSCWVFDGNFVHDNNNPNAPKSGYAGAGPVGTGMTVSGGRNDTVMDNTFTNNGAWGTLFLPFVDGDTPPAGVTCANSGGTGLGSLGCLYDAQGDALKGNTYVNNGFFGNPTNGDYANLTFSTGISQNCFAGNAAPNGSTPANLEQTNAVCGVKTTSANFSFTKGTLGGEVLCDSGLLGSGYCLTTDRYPQATTVTMHPLPSNLPTMPNPRSGMARTHSSSFSLAYLP